MDKDIRKALENATKGSAAKDVIIDQLIGLAQLTLLHPDTMMLSALIHAVAGAALLNQEPELIEGIAPIVQKLKEDATVLLEQAKKDKAEFEANAAETELATETDDFFDKNEIIH